MHDASASANASAQYWAFISYSHHDKRVARWLRHELARGSIPRSLRERVTPPDSHLRAIFLDEEEAGASAHLSDELRAKLSASHSLVVICSPFAVASAYVAEEIRYFQSLGRGDRVFCVIASGEPNAANAAIECFPEPLRTNAPLAPHVGDETRAEKNLVVEHIAAAILGLSPSRIARQRRREQAMRWALGGLAAFVVIALWAAFLMPYRTYAKSYVRRWGQWEEVDRVSRGQARQSPVVYEFERRGFLGRPRVVKLVNGSGGCPEPGLVNLLGDTLDEECSSRRGCEVRFRYALDGTLQQESILDQFGNVIETMSYTDRAVALFTEAGFGCSRSKTGIRYVQFARAPNGLDRRIDFFGEGEVSQREPRLTNEGAFGVLKDYDPRARVIARTLLWTDGKPHAGRGGFAKQSFLYDAAGCEIEQKLLRADGGAAISSDGWSVRRQTCDAHGRVIAIRYFDGDGAPVLIGDGYAGIDYQLDEKGNRVRTTYRDRSGTPVLNASLVASTTQTHDKNGYVITESYRGTNGELVLQRNGSAGVTYQRDEFGSKVEEIYAGMDGKPVLINDGYAIAAYTYDSRGNNDGTKYFDQHRRRTYGPRGWSAERSVYDDKNHLMQIDFFDAGDQRTLDTGGAAGYRHRYDAHGNHVEQRVIDLSGQHGVDNIGTATEIFVIDRLGRRIEARFQRLDGSSTDAIDGISVIRFQFDAFNRDIGESFFTWNGTPGVNHEGISRYVDELDAHGRLVKRQFFDVNGKPVSNEGFGFEQTFNTRGDVVEYRRLDAEGRVALGPQGWAIQRSTFDDAGNLVQLRYLDAAGHPITISEGYAGIADVFDGRRRRTKRTYLGIDGRPKDTKYGVATWLSKYDDHDNEVERTHLDATGKIVREKGYAAIVLWQHDERRRVIATTLFDVDRRPMRHPTEFWTTTRTRYDERGRVVSESYFDATGQPVLCEGGYAERRKSYDERGNEIRSEYFGVDGKPTQQSWVARMESRFNLQGKELERRFFDGAGKPALNPVSGRAVAKFIRDTNGHVIEESSYGAKEEPVNRKDDHWFRRVYTYSDLGRELSRKCYDVRDREVLPCPE